MRIVIITIAFVLSMGAANVQAEIIWDSGHHVFSEGSETYLTMLNDASADILGGIIHEFGMYNNTTADIMGGYISVVLGQDTSSVDVYEGGDIYLLRPNDSSTANVYGGDIDVIFALGSSDTHIYSGTINEIDAENLSTLFLYVDDYDFDPTGGSRDGGLITGTWLNNNGSFSISLEETDTIDHIFFVPEPGTLSLLIIGLVGLLHKR